MRTVYYSPEVKTEDVTFTGNPLIDFTKVTNNENDLDNSVSTDAPEDCTTTSSDKLSRRFSAKSEKRNKLFEQNKEKSNIELIRLLQKEEPTTLFLAAKKAVERWRTSTK
jgi:hypothetical protein